MEYLNLALHIITIALVVLFNVLNGKPSKRQQRRLELAEMAVGYAQMMGGDGKVKLTHAISAFSRLDLADNGKRDYSDAEARIAIESILAKK